MKHTLILTLLFILASTSCQHRTPTTSVFAEAESLMYTHPDSALKLLQAIPNPEQLTGKAQADYALLLTQAKSRDQIYATSDSLIRIAVDYYQNSDEMGQKAKSLLYLGDVLMDMERYTDATLPLKQAEELMDKIEDPHIQTLIYNSLGYLNREAGNYELCLTYYKKALQINRTNGYTEWQVSNLINIMNLPIPEFVDSAQLYIRQLQEAVVDARLDLQEKAYNNIGLYYKKQNQAKKAEAFFYKSIQAAKGMNYESYLNLAEIYESEKDIKRADSLYQLALQSPVWATQALVYENIYKRKLKLGQTEEAAHYMNAYIQAVDSFYTHRESEQIQEIQQKYDLEVILRQKGRIEIWLYRIVFSFIMLTGMLATYAQYMKKKSKAHLQALQEQINKITLSSESDKAEISRLNEMLAQSNVLKQALQLSTMEDLQALELYLRILQIPESYRIVTDLTNLKHWLDIISKNFAARLQSQYPALTSSQITICCLQRMGYSVEQMGTIMHIKIRSVDQHIYRICPILGITNDKKVFKDFILTY